MGTALTAQQVRLLSRYTDEVVLGYDGDRAGIEAAQKAAALMLGAGLVVRRARFPAGQDPDSLRLDEGPEAVLSVVDEARDAVALEIDDLPSRGELDPRLRAREAARVRVLIDQVKDPIAARGLLRARGRSAWASRWRCCCVNRAAAAERPGGFGAEAAPAVRRPRATSSIEEQVLRLIIAAPSLAGIDWADSDAFFDPALRTIYRAVREQAEGGY